MTPEERLQQVVDQGKAKVELALRSIQDEFEKRVDIVAKPPVIDYRVPAAPYKGNGTAYIQPIINGQEFSLTPHSESQLMARAGIPTTYARKLMDLGEGDLLKENLKIMTNRMMGDGVLVRRVDTVVKGWLSPAYKRMDASILFETFVVRVMKNGLVPYQGRNTDYRYQVQFLYPQVFTPARNEAVVYGLSLTTGDYGDQGVELAMMIMRIVCLNLAIGYDLFRRIHLGSRFVSEQDYVEFSNRTLKLDAKAIASGIGDIVDRGAENVKFLDEKIKRASEEEVGEGKLKQVLEGLKKKGISKEIVEKTKTVYEMDAGLEQLPSGNNLWRLSNAISLMAHSVKAEDMKIDMEKAAMEVVLN